MKPRADRSEIEQAVTLIEDLGMRCHLVQGTELTVLAAPGENRGGEKEDLEAMLGFEKVVSILAPFEMTSSEVKREATVVRVRDLVVGGNVGVIVGRCDVESREQIFEVVKIGKTLGRHQPESRLDANAAAEDGCCTDPAIDMSAIVTDLEAQALDSLDEVQVFATSYLTQDDVPHAEYGGIDRRHRAELS